MHYPHYGGLIIFMNYDFGIAQTVKQKRESCMAQMGKKSSHTSVVLTRTCIHIHAW